MNRTRERYLNKILLEAVEKELQKDELLQEGFMDFLNKINPFSDSSKKEVGQVETEDKESNFFNGHLVLDAVALVSGFIPGAGSVISFGADAINAIWYYNEGHQFIAALYFLMAIPGVGDVLALPIQGILKFGSKGINKLIPFFPLLFKNRLLIQSFLAKAIIVEEKLGVKGASKSTQTIIEKLIEINEKEGAEKAAEYLAKNIDKDLIKAGGKTGEKVSEKGLEKFLVKATEQAPKFAAKATYKAEQALIQRAILFGSKAFADDDASKTPDEGGGKKGKGGGGICHSGKTPKECTDLAWGCGGPSGPTSQKVKEVQQKLIDCGYPLPKFGVDGLFCTETQGATKNFQRDKGLTSNGVVDSVTLDALNKCNTSKTPDEPTPEPTPPPPPKELVPQGFGGASESLKRNRYSQVEKLVFERLVKGCK